MKFTFLKSLGRQLRVQLSHCWLYKRAIVSEEEYNRFRPTFELMIVPLLEAKIQAHSLLTALSNTYHQKLQALHAAEHAENTDEQIRLGSEIEALEQRLTCHRTHLQDFDSNHVPAFGLSDRWPVPSPSAGREEYLRQCKEARETVGRSLVPLAPVIDLQQQESPQEASVSFVLHRQGEATQQRQAAATQHQGDVPNQRDVLNVEMGEAADAAGGQQQSDRRRSTESRRSPYPLRCRVELFLDFNQVSDVGDVGDNDSEYDEGS